MIIHVKLPESEDVSRPLPFYLAMEEWLARKGKEGESFFFMWQVEPTVIFGRNQQISKEVDIEYCLRKGIKFYRRKSGGGCVYADKDNIMFSYVTPSANVQTTFSEYTGKVASMLRSLGLDAEASGRNDVMISGRKVSGNAFYHIPGRSIVHGTMLFSTNMENMLNAITPSKSKLESKMVKSVASHITTISEHLPHLSIEEFKIRAGDFMADTEKELTRKDIEEIEQLAEPYFTHRWIYGREAQKQETDERVLSGSQRIEGVGEFRVTILVDKSSQIIKDIDLQGDFFPLADLDEMLFNRMRGIKATVNAISEVVADTDAGSVISNLTSEQLRDILSSALQ